MFFVYVFFSSPSLTFFQIGQSFFYFVALINIFQKYVQCFFYFVNLINFSKKCSMFFFLKCFFSALPH